MKKSEDMNVVDGVQDWWCPHHHCDGVFGGLYIPHNPTDGHTDWKHKKEERKQKSKEKKSASSDSGGSQNAGAM